MLVNVNLHIDCYTIALTTNVEDEPIYRKAEKVLNERYGTYMRRFPNKSPQELWIYVALEMAVNFGQDARGKDMQPVLEKIKELSAKLADCLQDENK